MKKFICIMISAIMMSFAFAGCGNGNDDNMVADASKAGSDMATDASKIGSDIVNEIETMASDVVQSNGTVNDSDGFIGNEEKEDNKTDSNNSGNSMTSNNEKATDSAMQ